MKIIEQLSISLQSKDCKSLSRNIFNQIQMSQKFRAIYHQKKIIKRKFTELRSKIYKLENI